jgi:hypothetical protein
VQSGRKLLAVTGHGKKCLLDDANFSKNDEDLEVLDLEREFNVILISALHWGLKSKLSLVLNSAENPVLKSILSLASSCDQDDIHFVIRTRRMKQCDPGNFFTLAAETVVACLSNGHKRIDKYCAISLHLKKARRKVDENVDNQVEALEKIQQLGNLIIDEFNYQL